MFVYRTTHLNDSFQLYNRPMQMCIWSSEDLLGEINSLRQTSELVFTGCTAGVVGDDRWSEPEVLSHFYSTVMSPIQPIVLARMLDTYWILVQLLMLRCKCFFPPSALQDKVIHPTHLLKECNLMTDLQSLYSINSSQWVAIDCCCYYIMLYWHCC